MPEKISPQAWEQVEKNVTKAEKARRGSARASNLLYEKTGIPKEERRKKSPELPAEKNRVLTAAQERVQTLEQEAEQLLGETGSLERALVTLRKKNLITALHQDRNLAKRRAGLNAEETAILKDLDTPEGSELEALEGIRTELSEVTDEHETLLQSSPEAFYGLHLKELEGYKRELKHGRIVETPYVQKQAEDIVAHLQANRPVLVYGHFGSGKTELAMHVARKYLNKDALVISGAKHMSLAELYGHQVLSIDKINTTELDTFIKEVETKYTAWVDQHKDADEAEKNLTHDRILQTYLTQLKTGTVSKFFLGPIYRAIKEKRPIIIDEVTAIPHELLISLNFFLTRKPGDKLNVQQDSGEVIDIPEEGIQTMMTGNINQGQEQYIGRQDMDPAFLSRLYKLQYDYLPQKTEGSLEDEAGKENELFHLLLVRVMDQNGNAELPEDGIKKLWNLAKAARVIQDVFAGREINNAFYFKEAGGKSIKYILKEAVLTLRALEAIVEQWQLEGYKYELDYYLYKEFVSQSTQASDRAYLYQLLKDQFGFFKNNEWEQSPKYGSGGIVRSFSVSLPANLAKPRTFHGPREMVEFAFGEAPERITWPDTETFTEEGFGEATEDAAKIEKLRILEDFKKASEEDLVSLARQVVEFEKTTTAGASSDTELSPEPTVITKKSGFFNRFKKNNKKP
jgi:MoxR-like ATPase